jgi:hypothetical protein
MLNVLLLEEQSVYHQGYFCTIVFVINHIIQKVRELKFWTYLAFVKHKKKVQHAKREAEGNLKG